MADVVQGGAPAAAPSAPAQGGQGGGQTAYAPAQQRARVGEFNAFSAGIMPQLSQQPVHGADGVRGQGISVQNTEVLDRGYEPAPDPFDAQFSGQDATAQALAVENQQYDEQGNPVEQPLQAHIVNEAEIRGWLDERNAWIQSDDLPEPFHDKFVTARVDGKNYRIPVSEAVKGYQLQADYSNKLRELYAYRDNLQQRENGLQKLLMDMDDGQKFLDAMVFLGKFDGFSKAAIIYGTQLDAERRMTPEQRQVHQALRAQRAQLQRLEIENRNLRARTQPAPNPQQGPTNEQIQQIYIQQLTHIAPKVAAKLGFVASPMAQREFELHFNNMLPSIQGQDLTSEFVETVMIAAMQSVDAHLQRSGYGPANQNAEPPRQQPRVPAGQPQGGQWQRRQQLPPVSQLSGPSSGAQPPRQQRMRIGDFGALVAPRPTRQ